MSTCPACPANLWRKYLRLTRAVRTDAHWCAINQIWRRFDTALLPSFGTSMMLPEKDKTRDRHIGPDTSRKMQDMAHYQFKQRLHASTATRAGKRFFR